jgi:hypothetical protein
MNRFLSLAEFALIVALFFVIAGGAAPDVNEAHYLTKAKSYWQPDWCNRDLFLASADAHLVFYWLFGWVTRIVSLPATAWIGRLVGWTLLAASWMWLISSMEFGKRPGTALLTAAIAATLWESAHLAGEWILGGLEAKVPAYALVIFALGCALRGQHRGMVLSIAAAVALHPLVGGWAALACAYAMLREATPIAWRALMPAIFCGIVVAAVGVVPLLALDRAPADVTEQANLIYVYQRLPHHLVWHKMPPVRILRFAIMVVIWIVARQRVTLPPANLFLQRFAEASLWIAAGGLLWDAIGVVAPALAAKFLKYYWFRLADIAVPMALATLVAAWGQALYRQRSRWFSPAFVVTMVAIVAAVAGKFSDHRRDPRPGADRQGQILSAAAQSESMRRFRDWKSMCQWVQRFTPAESLFLTPTFSQTFKWYAGRAEVATWKDIPQDAQSVVEWTKLRERIAATGVYNSEMALDPTALQALIVDRDFDYVVTVREFGQLDWDLRVVFENATFQVYRCQ